MKLREKKTRKKEEREFNLVILEIRAKNTLKFTWEIRRLESSQSGDKKHREN